jgi:hypothetical protein
MSAELVAEYIETLPCPWCNNTGEHEDGVCYCEAGAALWASFEDMRLEQEDHRL